MSRVRLDSRTNSNDEVEVVQPRGRLASKTSRSSRCSNEPEKVSVMSIFTYLFTNHLESIAKRLWLFKSYPTTTYKLFRNTVKINSSSKN